MEKRRYQIGVFNSNEPLSGSSTKSVSSWDKVPAEVDMVTEGRVCFGTEVDTKFFLWIYCFLLDSSMLIVHWGCRRCNLKGMRRGMSVSPKDRTKPSRRVPLLKGQPGRTRENKRG
jgi:hypothetical protein